MAQLTNGKMRVVIYAGAILAGFVLIVVGNMQRTVKRQGEIGASWDSVTVIYQQSGRRAMAKIDSIVPMVEQIPALRVDVDTLKVRVKRLEDVAWPQQRRHR